jgi:hypothetical protein
VTVVVDTSTLLEMVLLDIADYNGITVPMNRNDEIMAARRKARREQLFPIRDQSKRSKAET